MGAEDRLAELGIQLPPAGEPVANYRMAVRSGNLLFVAGHGPAQGDGVKVRGKVGADLDLAEAREAARMVGVNLLATVRQELGSLDAVRRIVKLLGMVNCTEEFTRTPQVINGASDLICELWGEQGQHARSAVGLQQLPNGMAVEIESIFEVED